MHIDIMCLFNIQAGQIMLRNNWIGMPQHLSDIILWHPCPFQCCCITIPGRFQFQSYWQVAKAEGPDHLSPAQIDHLSPALISWSIEKYINVSFTGGMWSRWSAFAILLLNSILFSINVPFLGCNFLILSRTTSHKQKRHPQLVL